jgi:hypothetical protein
VSRVDTKKDENWTTLVFPLDKVRWAELLADMFPFLEKLEGVESVHFSIRAPKDSKTVPIPPPPNWVPNVAFRICCSPQQRNHIQANIRVKLRSLQINDFELDSNRSPEARFSDGFLGGVEKHAQLWKEHWDWRVKNLADSSRMVCDIAREGLLGFEANPWWRIQVSHLITNMLAQVELQGTLDLISGQLFASE